MIKSRSIKWFGYIPRVGKFKFKGRDLYADQVSKLTVLGAENYNNRRVSVRDETELALKK
jgi:hypothetical protein